MTVSGITDTDGKSIPHTIVKTMLRLDLPAPLAPGANVAFKLNWNFPINDMKRLGERTGYEFFEKDGNCTYTIAQWFPRLAAYTDYAGWMHKQFLGTGEFTLEFGNYTVRLTTPDDHVVGATGVLQNPAEVLSTAQRERLNQAQNETRKTVFIVTPRKRKPPRPSLPRGKNLGLQSGKRPRFRFRLVTQIHLGRHGRHGRHLPADSAARRRHPRPHVSPARHGDVPLPEGRYAALG